MIEGEKHPPSRRSLYALSTLILNAQVSIRMPIHGQVLTGSITCRPVLF